MVIRYLRDKVPRIQKENGKRKEELYGDIEGVI